MKCSSQVVWIPELRVRIYRYRIRIQFRLKTFKKAENESGTGMILKSTGSGLSESKIYIRSLLFVGILDPPGPETLLAGLRLNLLFIMLITRPKLDLLISQAAKGGYHSTDLFPVRIYYLSFKLTSQTLS